MFVLRFQEIIWSQGIPIQQKAWSRKFVSIISAKNLKSGVWIIATLITRLRHILHVPSSRVITVSLITIFMDSN